MNSFSNSMDSSILQGSSLMIYRNSIATLAGQLIASLQPLDGQQEFLMAFKNVMRLEDPLMRSLTTNYWHLSNQLSLRRIFCWISIFNIPELLKKSFIN